MNESCVDLIIGLVGTVGRTSRPFDYCKKRVLDDEKYVEDESSELKRSTRRFTSDIKAQDARAFICLQADPTICDATAYADLDDCLYLPYKKISHLFAEYENYHADHGKDKACKAGESTFRHVFGQVAQEKKLKLSGSGGNFSFFHTCSLNSFLNCFHIESFCCRLGSFETCDICSNADQLLLIAKKEHWPPQQKDIVVHWRRLHLRKQQREREHLIKNIEETRKLDAHGQPMSVLILLDGMTNVKGNMIPVILKILGCPIHILFFFLFR